MSLFCSRCTPGAPAGEGPTVADVFAAFQRWSHSPDGYGRYPSLALYKDGSGCIRMAANSEWVTTWSNFTEALQEIAALSGGSALSRGEEERTDG